ncbi:hypothetical protein [Hyphomicrobium sp.]|uniref:hypothetical protein n=1 Tax=Hyphomicrobium sp. TaxID=82 RepID=UPI002E36B7E1|nr:hypothetical protein [Hyphomicrobium sp.]HEX2843378.1 hypothetical protein [Hyphomicrobium sp.]
MRYFQSLAMATLSLAAVSAHGQDAPADLPGAAAFEPGSGRLWFAGCEFEADRYVTCKMAAPGVLEAIENPGDQTPGSALQTYVSDVFIEKGCAFEASPESFRVNGIFLSFDSKAAKDIRCAGKKSGLAFKPGVITLLDTIYFIAGDPPQ